MTRTFTYATRATRVVFGTGALESLAVEMARLPAERVMLIGTPGRREDLAVTRALLGTRVTATFEHARVHVPEDILARARDVVRAHAPDAFVALGGGSAIGLAKGLARETGIPIAAIPTTYSGSEMTSVWGVTTGATKTTGRDAKVAPALVLYDPALTLSLPADVSASSGVNAIAHCVEALYAPDASPMSRLFATEGLRLLAGALPRVVEHARDIAARTDALLGAHFAGSALDLTTMGLHHKLAHILGGKGLPHALTHAVLLPYVIEYQQETFPAVMRHIAEVLHSQDAVTGIRALTKRLGLTVRLGDLGLREADVEEVAALAEQGGQTGVAALLRRAL